MKKKPPMQTNKSAPYHIRFGKNGNLFSVLQFITNVRIQNTFQTLEIADKNEEKSFFFFQIMKSLL